jgi:hypothetical protein
VRNGDALVVHDRRLQTQHLVSPEGRLSLAL